VSKHFLGAPFGGYKEAGIGREECFEEMLASTQEKNIHVRLEPKTAKIQFTSALERRNIGVEPAVAGRSDGGHAGTDGAVEQRPPRQGEPT
jgi:hypothetical protein